MSSHTRTIEIHPRIFELLEKELAERGITRSRFFFELLGERYAARKPANKEFISWFRTMQKELELRDERRKAREKKEAA